MMQPKESSRMPPRILLLGAFGLGLTLLFWKRGLSCVQNGPKNGPPGITRRSLKTSTDDPVCILVDNGSLRAGSVKSLRAVAKRLSERLALEVLPASEAFSSQIDPALLDGIPAESVQPLMEKLLQKGHRRVVILPLFFGLSAVITKKIPAHIEAFKQAYPDAQFSIARPLVDINHPEDDAVARIMAEKVEDVMRSHTHTQPNTWAPPPAVIVVDHGSRSLSVNAVRGLLTSQIRGLLGNRVCSVTAASMENPGNKQFNQPTLDRALLAPSPSELCNSTPPPSHTPCSLNLPAATSFNHHPQGASGEGTVAPPPSTSSITPSSSSSSSSSPPPSSSCGAYPVIVSMAFLSPGRHAGEGGDVETIISDALKARKQQRQQQQQQQQQVDGGGHGGGVDCEDGDGRERAGGCGGGTAAAADDDEPTMMLWWDLDVRMTSLVAQDTPVGLIDILAQRFAEAAASVKVGVV